MHHYHPVHGCVRDLDIQTCSQLTAVQFGGKNRDKDVVRAAHWLFWNRNLPRLASQGVNSNACKVKPWVQGVGYKDGVKLQDVTPHTSLTLTFLSLSGLGHIESKSFSEQYCEAFMSARVKNWYNSSGGEGACWPLKPLHQTVPLHYMHTKTKFSF